MPNNDILCGSVIDCINRNSQRTKSIDGLKSGLLVNDCIAYISLFYHENVSASWIF